MSQKILISLQIQEEAPKKVAPEYCRPPLEDKIYEYIRRVESSEVESKYEWEYLKRVYEFLSKKKRLSDEEKRILYKLEPTIVRYANSDPQGMVDIDAQTMNRGERPDA